MGSSQLYLRKGLITLLNNPSHTAGGGGANVKQYRLSLSGGRCRNRDLSEPFQSGPARWAVVGIVLPSESKQPRISEDNLQVFNLRGSRNSTFRPRAARLCRRRRMESDRSRNAEKYVGSHSFRGGNFRYEAERAKVDRLLRNAGYRMNPVEAAGVWIKSVCQHLEAMTN